MSPCFITAVYIALLLNTHIIQNYVEMFQEEAEVPKSQTAVTELFSFNFEFSFQRQNQTIKHNS